LKKIFFLGTGRGITSRASEEGKIGERQRREISGKACRTKKKSTLEFNQGRVPSETGGRQKKPARILDLHERN